MSWRSVPLIGARLFFALTNSLLFLSSGSSSTARRAAQWRFSTQEVGRRKNAPRKRGGVFRRNVGKTAYAVRSTNRTVFPRRDSLMSRLSLSTGRRPRGATRASGASAGALEDQRGLHAIALTSSLPS